ncbi:NAD(P)-dependent oxidoreductase [Nisaea acidiphila]|uniref:NAD(P)-dependent oxidoreductase n=1 Tax=Nisaea acidiphila TaxID=1862145 RepID=A0A9J7AVP7_9PROT|nr:NAD(P)-dependent oxidoreductase [Nisaea acidiphila]UUX50874.1 NAD(P)-dependent oxidoreductase [Nisaea acidiphila]
MSEKLRVGFIGAGLMGHGMAKNLVERGFPLTVMGNRNRQPIDHLVSLGATEAKTARAVAEASDIVFLCLPNSAVVDKVVLGPDGIAEGAHDGLIVADSTTADPTETKRIGAALAEKGVAMLDTPLTMTPKEAEAGTLNVLVGGLAEVLERARPAIACFGRNIFHVGPLGAAHSLKLINNFMSMSMVALFSEAVVTARKAGVSVDGLHELISAGALNNPLFQKVMDWPLKGDASGLQFAIENALKDVSYYNRVAADAGATAPIGATVQQIYALANAQGEGKTHVPKLMDVLGRLNGL